MIRDRIAPLVALLDTPESREALYQAAIAEPYDKAVAATALVTSIRNARQARGLSVEAKLFNA